MPVTLYNTNLFWHHYQISLPILLAQLDYGQAGNVHRLCRADISRQISRIGAAFGIGP